MEKHTKEYENQPPQTSEKVRQLLLEKLEADKLVVAQLSDEQLKEVAGGLSQNVQVGLIAGGAAIGIIGGGAAIWEIAERRRMKV